VKDNTRATGLREEAFSADVPIRWWPPRTTCKVRAMELTFTDGQAEIPLADGTTLSIINSDRDAVLREARKWNFGLGPFPMTRAGVDTYEVALKTEDDSPAGEIPGWDAYDNGDQEWSAWTTYGYVPLSMIEEYVEKIGRA
jgi:hypothetical protein